MKRQFFFGLLSLLPFFYASSQLRAKELPTHCVYDKECLIELPGLICADGTPSYFTISFKKNAEHMLIFLEGGGACWNEKSCKNGLASTLTRVKPQWNWESGKGIFDPNDSLNPFSNRYHIVSVPYCTGDAFTGSNIAQYASGYTIRHQGSENVQLLFQSLTQIAPIPNKVVLLGSSAGGIGALFNLRHLANAFPLSEKYVISDGGVPIKPPQVHQSNYAAIVNTWGTAKAFPISKPVSSGALNFGDIIRFNIEHYPEVKFALIAGYKDLVMSYFSFAIGSPSPAKAVRGILTDVANELIDPSTTSRYFYFNDTQHTYSTSLEASSEGSKLGNWLADMLKNSAQWNNVRPSVTDEEMDSEDIPKSINELKQRGFSLSSY